MGMVIQGESAADFRRMEKPYQNSRVKIDYTNWRGERSKRTIQPFSIRFGVSEWHRIPQWLLTAWTDAGRREFAMKDIHSWEEIKP